MENYGIWGILPPLLVIVLAFITKDVIVSLTLGIFVGSVIVSHGNVFMALIHLTDKIAGNLADGWNIRILMFCLLLGGLVGLMIRTGATNAFADWAKLKIKDKRTSLIITWCCGIIIFIDDYFNSLAVGTIMRPITDKFNVSRAKLSYFLDSTAAPVCIIAPISSWVVTVMSLIKESEGFDALGISEFVFFIRSIPYNIYAILTLCTVFFIAVSGRDFGRMKHSEELAAKGILYDNSFGSPTVEGENEIEVRKNSGRAHIYDMIIPIIVLIATAVFMFPMTTYLQAIDTENVRTLSESIKSMSIGQAFNNTDASCALFYAIVITLIFTYIYYIARKLFNIAGAYEALIKGISKMIPAGLILALAWTIGGIIKSSPADGGLGLSSYLSHVFITNHFPIRMLPVLVFLVSALISFATGTSWGTFSIMIPITMPIVIGLSKNVGMDVNSMTNIALFTISAILSGAVFGDHSSPISDSTILSSTGAGCPHLEHVATQIPYAALIAFSACLGYFIGGICSGSIIVSWIVALAVVVLAFTFLPNVNISFLNNIGRTKNTINKDI